MSGGTGSLSNLDRIKQLEQDLKVSNEVSLRLQKELEESNRKLEESTKTAFTKKKAPLLGSLGKSPSSEGVSCLIIFVNYVKLCLSYLFIFSKKYRENHLQEVVHKMIQLNY